MFIRKENYQSFGKEAKNSLWALAGLISRNLQTKNCVFYIDGLWEQQQGSGHLPDQIEHWLRERFAIYYCQYLVGTVENENDEIVFVDKNTL